MNQTIQTKRCSRCKTRKPRAEFPPSNRKYQNSWCRPCKRIEDRDYQRRRRANNPGLKTKEFRKYRKQYPEKARAHKLLNLAVKAGTIKKQPCYKCGAFEKPIAHHSDYSKPYLVEWVCPVHHKELHAHKNR